MDYLLSLEKMKLVNFLGKDRRENGRENGGEKYAKISQEMVLSEERDFSKALF